MNNDGLNKILNKMNLYDAKKWIKIIDKILRLKNKEIQELKEENENLNWMLKKQFDHSLNQIRKEKNI